MLRKLAPLALVLAACAHAPAKTTAPPAKKRAYRTADPIHVAIAPRIRDVSMLHGEIIREVSAANVPPPSKRALRPAPPPPAPADGPLRTPADLRGRVGMRDKRDANAIVLAWATELGRFDVTSTELVAWAEREGRLFDADAPPDAGDLLVFDKVVSDEPADLIALVIGRDERGVTEFVYVGNGVVRRGFVDVSRPAKRRDKAGAVVNTYLRHGKRWPLKGSHYLAGEHLAHVIR